VAVAVVAAAFYPLVILEFFQIQHKRREVRQQLTVMIPLLGAQQDQARPLAGRFQHQQFMVEVEGLGEVQVILLKVDKVFMAAVVVVALQQTQATLVAQVFLVAMVAQGFQMGAQSVLVPFRAVVAVLLKAAPVAQVVMVKSF
jgi:hypothetical protein